MPSEDSKYNKDIILNERVIDAKSDTFQNIEINFESKEKYDSNDKHMILISNISSELKIIETQSSQKITKKEGE